METIFDIAQIRLDIKNKEVEVNDDSFWIDNPNANDIFSQLSKQKKIDDDYCFLEQQKDDLKTFFELL